MSPSWSEMLKNETAPEDQEHETFVEEDEDETEYSAELKSLASEILSVPAADIRINSNLFNDLGVDSLMKVELLAALETEYGLHIPDEMAYEINTFGDLLKVTSEYRMGRTDDVSVSDEDVDAAIKRNIIIRMSRMFFTFCMRVAFRMYFRLKVRGVENIKNLESFIIAPNHSSMLDFPLLFSSLPFSKVRKVVAPAAKDYFYSGFFRKWFLEFTLNTFAFERLGNFIKSLKICGEIIKRGKSIILFPEGTRTVEGTLGPFKPGIGSLSAELAVPIIPTYIAGAYNALPKGSILPRPRKITVFFAEPVYADQIDTEGRKKYEIYKELTAIVREKIIELKNESGNK